MFIKFFVTYSERNLLSECNFTIILSPLCCWMQCPIMLVGALRFVCNILCEKHLNECELAKTFLVHFAVGCDVQLYVW